MKKSTLAGLTGVVVGAVAFAAGVAVGPSITDREVQLPSAIAVAEAAASEAPAPAATPPRSKTRVADRARPARVEPMTIAPDVVPRLSATAPALQERLKPILSRGTELDVAAKGFVDGEEFATVAHLAKNTNVPFAVLKHRIVEQRRSLGAAVRELRPEVDATREVMRARNAARFDIAVATSS